MNKTKTVSTRLLFLAMILSVQTSHGTSLSINNSGPIDLSEDVMYSLGAQNVQFMVSEPIICRTKITSPGSVMKAEIVDANGNGKVVPILSNIAYDLNSQQMKLDVNNVSSVCATANGSTYGDIIFRSKFQNHEVRYEGLSDQIVRGHSLDYKIIVDNIDDAVLRFDLVEYTSEVSPNHLAYIESIDYWNCNNNGVAGVVCNDDNTEGLLKNASVPVNGKVEIDVTRTVSSASVIGQSVDFMTAVFLKNQSNQFIDVIVISHKATVIDNFAPVLSWLNSPLVALVEDDNLPQTLQFKVVDATGVNLDPVYLSSVIGDSNDKLDFSNFNAVQNSPSEHTVSFDIVPKPNQFTGAGNSNKISVQIEDAFGAFSNPLSLPVTIDPTNDAPSFNVSCHNLVLNPTPIGSEQAVSCNDTVSSGATLQAWQYNDWLENLTAGEFENGQTLMFNFVDVVDNDEILDFQLINNLSANMLYDDLLVITNPDASGTASFKLQAVDNGGVSGNGCAGSGVGDGCDTYLLDETITITLLENRYFLSGVVNGLPGQFDNIELNLFDSLVGGGQIGQTIVSGVVGGGSVSFDFNSIPFLNGSEYRLEFTEPNCDFIVNGNPIGDVLSGTINEQNVNNINITCN
jgi:hypothetical protein